MPAAPVEQFGLHAGPMDQVVLVLQTCRRRESVPVGHPQRFDDLGGRVVAHADIPGLALPNHVIHGVQGLFQGRVGIEMVQEIEIDMIQSKALQRTVDFPHDMIAGGALVVRPRSDFAPDLAGDHQVVPLVLHGGQGLAQHCLAPAAEVEVRAVDEVNP